MAASSSSEPKGGIDPELKRLVVDALTDEEWRDYAFLLDHKGAVGIVDEMMTCDPYICRFARSAVHGTVIAVLEEMF